MRRWGDLPTTQMDDDPPRPAPRDVSYRSHHEMQEAHALLVRRYGSEVLRALLEAASTERDMAHGVCADAGRRLWQDWDILNADVQPPFGWPLLVRDFAKWALSNPHKVAL